jgi:DNA-directed RNA polymerase sigma subunit (sigma70/sigma32)
VARTDPRPELNPSQRLLRVVFGYDYHTFPPQPKVDDRAVDQVAVWRLIDEVLSDREALVLKYHFGQVGRCHTMKEIARILSRADGRGIGVTRNRVGDIEEEALEKLRHPLSRMLLHLAKCGPPESPAPAAALGVSSGTSLNETIEPDVLDMSPRATCPEPNSSQRLLMAIFGWSYDELLSELETSTDDRDINEASVWQIVDEVLTEREALLLKYRFGQVGRGHTLREVGQILPRAYGAGIGLGPERVRQMEAKAMRKIRHPKNSKRLLRLAEGGAPEPLTPLLNSAQRLLREVFTHDCSGTPFYGRVDDHDVNEAAVWQFVDEVLSVRESLVLKYRFGQAGRCHTVREMARILPTPDGGIGVRPKLVRRIQESALRELRRREAWLRYLAAGGPRQPSPETIDMPLEKMGLSPRSLDCLKRNKVTRVGELLEKREQDLMAMKGFGKESLEMLKWLLWKEGLSLVSEKKLTCADCGSTFAFTVACVPELYASMRCATEQPKRCPTCLQARKAEGGPAEKAGMQLSSLGLSTRLFNWFRMNDITNAEQLLEMSEWDLMEMRDFGKKSLEELKECLLENGLSLQQR